MRIDEMTWMQVEAYLERDDRCVLPLGSTEQHAYISLATDSILSERVSLDAAAPLGVPVFPVVSYGITPYFMAYPGTVTLSLATYERVLGEILASLREHGFRRILVVNGHGGNSPARPAVEAWAEGREGVELRWHDWWKAPLVRAAIDALDSDASHASWMETFPWTRIAGVTPPAAHKNPVDLSDREELTPGSFRDILGDGSFGGDYLRSDNEMTAIWKVAVGEAREILTRDWAPRPGRAADGEDRA
ncbi:MAG: creatininase family protein [Gemmatimonadota bacterium]|nr:creatininase family protein [Gemmatimonadota bacterium]